MKRWDSGTYDIVEETGTRIVVAIVGQHLGNAGVEITRGDDGWVIRFSVNGNP